MRTIEQIELTIKNSEETLSIAKDVWLDDDWYIIKLKTIIDTLKWVCEE